MLGVATALLMSTVALVSGFGAVLTSALPDFRLFAAMACSTIGSALIGDLVFLPALLLVFRPRAAASQADGLRVDLESNVPNSLSTGDRKLSPGAQEV